MIHYELSAPLIISFVRGFIVTVHCQDGVSSRFSQGSVQWSDVSSVLMHHSVCPGEW
jgi:hypothetical protein